MTGLRKGQGLVMPAGIRGLGFGVQGSEFRVSDWCWKGCPSQGLPMPVYLGLLCGMPNL